MGTRTAPQSVDTAVLLCVDLDSTLIKTDLAWECVARLLRRPLVLLGCAAGITAGLSEVKHRLAEHADLDLARIPLRPEVLDYIEAARQRGRTVVLATAADSALADGIAARVGLFDAVIAGSRGGENLKGLRKLAAVERRFPSQPIEYLGDSRSDRAIFERVPFATRVASRSRGRGRERVKPLVVGGRGGARSVFAALRPAHWSKNALIFIPLLLGHRWRDLPDIVRGGCGFVAFCLAASAVYVLNDLADLESDRLHAWKRLRPFAAGQLSIPLGISLAIVLASASLALAFGAGGAIGAFLIAAYFLSSFAYSFSLKRKPILDVLVLSSFYLQRVFFGGYLSRVVLSNWLLAFCGFFFFSLALAKRCSELLQAGEVAQSGRSGRGYFATDLPFLRELGIASGLVSVLVIALYVNSSEITLLYRHAQILWAVVPILLFWISRIWLFASRGLLVEDPIGMAFKDRVSIFAGALLVAVALFATY